MTPASEKAGLPAPKSLFFLSSMMLGSLRSLVEALGCELRVQVRRRDEDEWMDLSTSPEDQKQDVRS
jgi:hypothetical protein